MSALGCALLGLVVIVTLLWQQRHQGPPEEL